ncbi:MAG: hypothetical protein ABW067_09720 [Rhizobacter sp.]
MPVSSNPFALWSGQDVWRNWLPPASGGGTFVQPILPWTLNINNVNSRSPETEAAVVAKHSYGRQIGRIADVLHTLLEERHGDLLDTPCVAEFMAMWNDVEAVKAASAADRVRQLAADLASIKANDPREYAQLRALLKSSL